MTTEQAILSLSTAVEPAKVFTVDGEPFHVLGIMHLSESGEAQIVALFAQYARVQRALELVSSRYKGERLAARLREMRLEILTSLTDMPATIAGKLPLPEQVKLLDLFQAEMEGTSDSSPEDGSDDIERIIQEADDERGDEDL